ncbi:YggT family protein [Helicobacter pametensis]|uniref:YggT family protein n=1 Tax=Helicobacter pametensis TaxID=95149 RepID=UPI0004876B92|nr:YggT family protein [Helicobacter pametensis]
MIISTFLNSILQIASMILNAYIWMIIIYSCILLFAPTFNHPIMQIFDRLTSPVYQKIRKIIPTVFNQIDFTPLLLIIILKFIDLFVIRLLSQSL